MGLIVALVAIADGYVESFGSMATRSGSDLTARPRRWSVSESFPVSEQHSLTRSVILHLAPGALFTAFIVLAAPALAPWGVDPVFVLFGGIGFILVPIELGYLALEARRTTGSWSPLKVVNYKERVPGGRLALLAGGLAIWFLLVLLVSIAFLEAWSRATCFHGCPTPSCSSPS